MDTTCIFKRVEKKYLLSEARCDALMGRIGCHLRPDEFGLSTVMSLYLDTPDHRIIRASLDAADYKEKLRLRSYGTARPDTTVFLELKKKFGGVVYKRRAAMSLAEAERFLKEGVPPRESQILSELDWALRLYGRPQPAMLIACEREAWFDEEHPDLRLTFDRDIRCRETDLTLRRGSAGVRLLPEGRVLLEIKTGGAMPLWLADALDELRILPGSFSKYGAAYLRSLAERRDMNERKGDDRHVVSF